MDWGLLIDKKDEFLKGLSDRWDELWLLLIGALKGQRDPTEAEELQEILHNFTQSADSFKELETLLFRLEDREPEFSLLISRVFLKLFFKAFQNEREKSEFLKSLLSELATPILKVCEKVILQPLVGHIDSDRAQVMAEALLEEIKEHGAETVIIDVTGVPIIDTAVADHLLSTIAAIRLMGVEVILCGIQPQIAKTLVKLNIDLSSVTITRSLEEALQKTMNRQKQREL